MNRRLLFTRCGAVLVAALLTVSACGNSGDDATGAARTSAAPSTSSASAAQGDLSGVSFEVRRDPG